jgi:replicative superfamily II helicase
VCFLFGRYCGRVEAAIIFSQRINLIIDAIRKVEKLASLRGEDISKLTSDEIVHRAQKQMEIKNGDS